MVLGPFLLPRSSGKWRLLEIPAPKMCNVILVLTIASWVRGRSNTALQKSPATFFVKVPSHKSSFLIVKFPFPLMALMASQSIPPKTYHPRNSRPYKQGLWKPFGSPVTPSFFPGGDPGDGGGGEESLIRRVAGGASTALTWRCLEGVFFLFFCEQKSITKITNITKFWENAVN